MKREFLLIVMFLLSLVIGCNSKEQPAEEESLPKRLMVVAYDISVSTDEFATLKESDLEIMYDNLRNNGGGTIVFLYIKENSLLQDVIEFEIHHPEKKKQSRGNFYQQRNKANIEKESLDEINKERNEFIQASKSFIKPKDESWTDLYGALALCKVSLEQESYKNFRKRLVIISDGVHDPNPKSKIKQIKYQPFEYASDVEVYLVRSIKKDFIKGKIFDTNTIKDAFTF